MFDQRTKEQAAIDAAELEQKLADIQEAKLLEEDVELALAKVIPVVLTRKDSIQ